MAETECVVPFVEKLEGVSIGDFFTQPVVTLPDFYATIRDYMGMPEDGFDKPSFMGHGLVDQDVPLAATATYAATLLANGEPLRRRHRGVPAGGAATWAPVVRPPAVPGRQRSNRG